MKRLPVGRICWAGLVVPALTLTACVPPTLYFGGSRGKDLDLSTIREGKVAGLIGVCVGEPITIGWLCENCDSLTVTPMPGSIDLTSSNPGMHSFVASTDATYEAKAVNGNGETKSTFEVLVVGDGQGKDEVGFSAQTNLSAGWPFWDYNFPNWAFSPEIRVTGERFTPGFPIPVSTSDWSIITPEPHTAPISPTWLDIPETPLIGYWRVGTDGLQSREGLPATLAVNLKLSCPNPN